MAFHQRKDRMRLFISQYGPNGNINVKTDWIQWKGNKRIALYPCCVLSSGQPWSRGSKDKPFVGERFVDWDNVSRRKSPNGSGSQLHFVVAKRKKKKERKNAAILKGRCWDQWQPACGSMLTWDPPWNTLARIILATCAHLFAAKIEAGEVARHQLVEVQGQ